MQKTNVTESFNGLFAVKLRGLLEKSPKTGEKTTYKQLSAHLGVRQQSVSSWANGTSVPDTKHIAPIAIFFGVSADYLLGLDELPTREATDIHEKTGLSNAAIETLIIIKEYVDAINRGEKITIPASQNSFEFRRRVSRCGEELEAISLLIEHGTDLPFFRKLWDYLFAEYFPKDEDNPAYEENPFADFIYSAFSRFVSGFGMGLPRVSETEKIKGTHIAINADTYKGEREEHVSMSTLNAAHRIELMDMLDGLKTVIKTEGVAQWHT